MRINEVKALAFGPLADETLTLAPGMTVVIGDNESAKSSWHAAIHAALCGRRRGRGKPTSEEKRFADLHRPWDRTKWAVAATLTLDDGRNVEMHQDLDGKVDCRASDLDLGARDISSEIMFDGSPDASRWLGLDRRSFSATACVNQAELLAVLDQAGGLQVHLQRAAATAGTDATAAAAIRRLDEFSRDRVGTDRANSGKPLRRAKTGVEQAQAAQEAARNAHDEYLQLLTAADAARHTADGARVQVQSVQARASGLERALAAAQRCVTDQGTLERLRERAAGLTDELEQAARRLQRATELDERFLGVPPAGTLADDATTQQVTSALSAYRSAPLPALLTGRSSAELVAALASLPAPPTGDTVVHGRVASPLRHYRDAEAVARGHADERPGQPDTPSAQVVAAVAAGPQRVRELASWLDSTRSSAPEAVRADEVTDAQRDRDLAAQQYETASRHEQLTKQAADGASADLKVTEATREAEKERAAELAAARQAAEQAGRRQGAVLLGLGVLMALAAVSTVALASVVVAAVLAVVAVAAMASGVVVRARASSTAVPGSDTGRPPADADLAELRRRAENAAAAYRAALAELDAAGRALREAEGRLAGAQARCDTAQAQLAEAAEAVAALQRECGELGLPHDGSVLRELASAAEAWADADQAYRQWEARVVQLQRAVDASAAALTAELDARDAAPANDLLARASRYEQDCAQRAEQAALTGQRGALERELEAQRSAEATAATLAAARARADEALLSAAGAAGIPGAATASVEDLVPALEAWRQERQEALGQVEQVQQEWAELQNLLAGGSLRQLAEAADERKADAAQRREEVAAAQRAAADTLRTRDELLAAVEERALPDDGPGRVADRVEETLVGLRERLSTARDVASSKDHDAAKADGALRERARLLPSVAEAEERQQQAQAELGRVMELDDTLRRTRDFLEVAQQRVHRDIAPVIAATLTEWLPEITNGRYVDARVDPETLEVRVCGAARTWRQADLLSHGTAEQVYLLLRVALARHLVKVGTMSPLLLDDVTVQADSKRTLQILGWLHKLSEQQQVVLFAQQSQVADWARATLTGSQDAVVELSPVSSD